jgi:hypothetical protein
MRPAKHMNQIITDTFDPSALNRLAERFGPESMRNLPAIADQLACEVDRLTGLLRDEIKRLEILIDAHAAVAENPTPWRPLVTAPKHGRFLVGVWEGEWRNPRQRFVVHGAWGTKHGVSWHKRASYRTEEGEAYEAVGWMPAPGPPNTDQSI